MHEKTHMSHDSHHHLPSPTPFPPTLGDGGDNLPVLNTTNWMAPLYFLFAGFVIQQLPTI